MLPFLHDDIFSFAVPEKRPRSYSQEFTAGTVFGHFTAYSVWFKFNCEQCSLNTRLAAIL